MAIQPGQLILDNHAFCKCLINMIRGDFNEGNTRNKKCVSLCYFMKNVYVGYTASGDDTHEWSEKWHTQTRAVLDAIADNKIVDADIILSLNPLILCSAKHDEPCEKCYEKYAEYLIKIENTVNMYPNINWKYAVGGSLPISYLHKYSDGSMMGLVGARNLTNADNLDASVVIDGGNCSLLESFKNDNFVQQIDKSFVEDVMEAISV